MRLILLTPDRNFSVVADGLTLLQCAARVERYAAPIFPRPLSECDDFRMGLAKLAEPDPNRQPVRRYACPRFQLCLHP